MGGIGSILICHCEELCWPAERRSNRSSADAENRQNLEGGALSPPNTQAALTAQHPPPDTVAWFPDSL